MPEGSLQRHRRRGFRRPQFPINLGCTALTTFRALPRTASAFDAIERIVERSPPRRMTTVDADVASIE